MATKHVRVTEEDKQRLDAWKVSEQEPYSSVIGRVLDAAGSPDTGE